MSNPPTGFQPCYQHPNELTGIRCQRCGKPICAACMNPASVGFQCPSCSRGLGAGRGPGLAAGGRRPRQPRTSVGARIDTTGMKATFGLLGTIVVLSLLDVVSGGLVSRLLSFAPVTVADLQLWRPFTYTLLSDFPIGLLLNGLVLWIVGRALEPVLGWWRFLAVYLASGLGGALLLTWIGLPTVGFSGASIAVLGLIGANAAMKLKTGEDIRPDLILLAILVVANLVLGFANRYWAGQIGGLVAAAAATLTIVFAPRERRTLLQVVGLAAIGVVCLAGMVALA